MIKTDEVIYRIRTQEEYDWLMQELEKAGCRWMDGTKPSKLAIFYIHISNTYIYIKDKKLSYGGYDHYRLYHNSEECIEVSDIMKKPLKTDKVIYRTNTQEEYDWLMEQLEEAGCKWSSGYLPTKANYWRRYFTETCINFNDDGITFADFDFYKNKSEYIDYEFIEVSDLMEDEEETEILDKLEDLKDIENEFENLVEQEEETDAREKLDAINTQINKQIEDLRKQGKEPKAVEYTIKVCFE